MGANAEILDRAIKHGIYLDRYRERLVREILGYLNDRVYPGLLAQIYARLARFEERGFDLGPSVTYRLQIMQQQIAQILSGGSDAAEQQMRAALGELASYEAGYSAKLFDSLTPGAIQWSLPSASLLKAIVDQRPIGGALLSDWWDKFGIDTSASLMRAIRYGIATGQTTEDIVRAIRGTKAAKFKDGILDASRRSIQSLVRTATSSVAAQAREDVYKENEDFISGVQWIATLDDRTCIECGALDGKIFDSGDGDRPPLHVGCRCTTVPVIKSWRALGIAADEASPGMRASLDGVVPESMTFNDWLEKQSADTQDEVLGATRGEAYRSGDLEIKDFVSSRTGDLLSLDQMRAKEPELFAN